jgi:hypothetical protein
MRDPVMGSRSGVTDQDCRHEQHEHEEAEPGRSAAPPVLRSLTPPAAAPAFASESRSRRRSRRALARCI